MLTSLCIKNFTIVAELELDFAAGMSAFTGETGAGKSIMIDALMLALGGRADASVIRPGGESCDIQACFICSVDSDSARWLLAHDLAVDDDIFLRRVITREGRSKAYINGVAFPLQKVKELGVTLVHIHGQHEHQTLFSATTHRDQPKRYYTCFSLKMNFVFANDCISVYKIWHACRRTTDRYCLSKIY